jgi:hypothetical protein
LTFPAFQALEQNRLMASRDQNRAKDKPAADLLRRTLASAAGEAGLHGEECPDPEILAAYADRALDANETSRYELHFSQCARCREQLAAMSQAVAPAPDTRAPRIGWVWTWGWLALAPVTAALLIAAIFIARRPAANHATEQEQPLVAMQTPNQQPEARESAPAKTTIPPSSSRMHSEAGSMQRSDADFTDDVKSENSHGNVSQSPEVTEPGKNSVSSLPLQSRNDTAADNFENPELRKPASSAQSADAAATRTKTENVTVDSGAAVEPLSAPVAAPLAGGVAAAKKAPEFTANTSINFAARETGTLESPADRDARMIVRSPDPHILWRISSGRFVERSSDAGSTWRAQWTSANAHVVAGSSPSADACWLVGRGGIVLLTTDGKKWRAIESPADVDFVQVEASSADSAVVTSAQGHKFETSDGGKHWTPAP